MWSIAWDSSRVPYDTGSSQSARAAGWTPWRGLGESTVIAYAELDGEYVAVLDDRDARRVAEMRGIRYTGVLGLIGRAHDRGVPVEGLVRDMLEAGRGGPARSLRKASLPGGVDTDGPPEADGRAAAAEGAVTRGPSASSAA